MKVYDDESVDAFLTRRFGPKIARQFGSALVHGVYATDSRLLSVRAAFPSLWDAEDRGRGSVISGILRAKKSDPATEETFETGELMQAMDKVSVFSFKDGMQTLPDTLSERLRHAPNVDIRLSTTVAALQATQQGIEVFVTSRLSSSSYAQSWNLILI
jgi:oxygen-dependent protoporphyrinogen oxidase